MSKKIQINHKQIVEFRKKYTPEDGWGICITHQRELVYPSTIMLIIEATITYKNTPVAVGTVSDFIPHTNLGLIYPESQSMEPLSEFWNRLEYLAIEKALVRFGMEIN